MADSGWTDGWSAPGRSPDGGRDGDTEAAAADPAHLGPYTFLVRLWIEPRETAGAQVRAPMRVRYLQTGQERAVPTLSELTRFISACLDRAGVPPREPDWSA